MSMLPVNLQWILPFLWILRGLQNVISEPAKSIDITGASYQVAVETGGEVCCGGSIVNHQWVISAASCLYNLSTVSKTLRVRAGTSRILYKGSFHFVSNVVIHPQFNKNSNDIALIELSVPFKFKRSIQPITLASKPQRPKGRITGWGILNKVTTNYSQILLQREVTIMNKTDCGDLFGTNLLCVNDSSVFYMCDPGSPLIVGRQLVGIAVHCSEPDLKNNISTFTDVSQYKRWILQTIYKYY